MSDPKLLALLKKLHDEIDSAEPVDDRGRAILEDLDGHVHDLMHRAEQERWKAEPEMVSQFDEALRHFEVTHPNLTAAIASLLDTLSGAGI